MNRVRGGVAAPKDFKAGGLHCGIKKKRKDLAIIASTVPAVACGMFTQNRVKAAPILVDKEHLKKTTAQAIIVNSGNANCCTGARGLKDAYRMAELAARELGIAKEDVLVASTGIIGVDLPMKNIEKAAALLVKGLSKDGGHDVAEAIMTTDRVPKEIAFKMKIKGRDVTIGAVAKGAGMIHPNMATMLCFITTDAYITRRALKAALRCAVEKSFNRISIDGDMSTNDAVLALANGSAGNKLLDRKDKDFKVFSKALDYATEYLAKAMIMDGEGATKFVRLNIINAKRNNSAKRIANKVTTSTLFKTALFGEDPNWGRIAASAGASGVAFNPRRLDIYIGKIMVMKAGAGTSKNKSEIKRLFKKREIEVTIDLNSGNKSYSMWMCDLSSNYVRINAHYTT